MNYVYSHLGESLPPHLLDSIKSVRLADPSASIYVCTDIPTDYSGCKVMYVHEVISEETEQMMDDKLWKTHPLANDSYSRLWSTSIYRCFLIRDVAKKLFPDEGYVHFDSDVLLYEPFENISHLLVDDRICLTCHNDLEAPFGYYFFPSYKLNDILCEHVLRANIDHNYMRKLSESFPSIMQVIGGLKNCHPELFLELNPIPNENSSYIFDPSSYGQFFGGTYHGDPPGWYGTHQYVGAEISKGNIKPIMQHGRPYVEWKNKIYPIVNLHVHSKNTKKFL